METTISSVENGIPHHGRFLHLLLPVGNLEGSLEFYTKILGMRLLRRQDYPEAHIAMGFVGYEEDAAMLGLRYDWGHHLPTRAADCGTLAIGVPDWDSVTNRLKAAGIAVHFSPAGAESGRIALLHDPDGYEIEIIEERVKPDAPQPGTSPAPAELARPNEQNTVSPAVKRKEASRERILEAAGRGFRMRGYGGIGVDGLAKEAGVTSGAFYGHFRSKEEAFQAAVTVGIDDFRAGVEQFRTKHGADWVRDFARWYLGKAYLEDIAGSCALPSLSPDVVRSDKSVRLAYEVELRKLAAAVAAGLPSSSKTQKERDAWIFLALLAGGVTLARAVEDETLEAKIAEAVQEAVIGLADGKSCEEQLDNQQ